MGGNAFDNTQRLSEEAYNSLCKRIAAILEDLRVKSTIPPEIKDKAELVLETKGYTEPYGDVDLIVAVDDDEGCNKVSDRVALEVMSPEPIHRNNKTHSILTRERYQVDLLFCHPEELEFLSAVKSNNDFVAFFGHLLTRFHLKLSEKGLVLVMFADTSRSKKADVVLCKDQRQICDFFELPHRAFDGRTRLSTFEVFEALTRTNVYFHEEETSYDERYKSREGKKGRPMIDKMFHYLDSYNGSFEQAKEEKKARKAFRIFLQDNDHKKLENFLLRSFGKLVEGERVRLARFRRDGEARNFTFGKMLGWYPDALDKAKGIEIMKSLRGRYGQGGNDLFDVWLQSQSEENLKKIVGELIEQHNF